MGQPPTKTIENSFTDWEAHVFGFGYGTGEEHTIPALKRFLGLVGAPGSNSPTSYDYLLIQKTINPTVVWLLINFLCKADILEYGTSPRFGWLTPQGEALKTFVDSKQEDELIALTCADENYIGCSPDSCNCGPNGYESGRKCINPFWRNP